MTAKTIIKKFTPNFLLRFYHFCWAFLGAFLFGFPGYNKNIKIIGVTGTSGKSTTSDLITRILEEPFDSAQGRSNYKVASISTIRFKIGAKEWENKYKMTMPGRFVIQKFLKQAKNAGCKYFVLEVTSEGIRQFRHKFINFDTAVFTNLTAEHIESHGGFENYRNEKLKLFRATKNIHVMNADDENAKYFLNIPARQKIKFSIIDAKKYDFKLNLIGDFNVLNALAAISVAKAYGVDFETCKRALEKAKGIAGRMEVVSENPKIIVDYAHTPEQLEAVYKSLTTNYSLPTTNLICVLGSCGGGRDKWKRPVLGKIAVKYCREIIITNEDPYDENPLSIMKEIESGFSQIRNQKSEILNYKLILDRKEAIQGAVKSAKPGDVVIITGKGSEPWMCVENGKKIPWDDRQIAIDALQK
ncbi:MAG: UDP-N-acetylmuramoyl-L-alanyl-D-glutamate-2,6-diaminopimelate ligase [Parcubacteria group bacterium GW2011_GWA2_37_10]|nr:MAG: UDP-N-acetylmuramoyl-L-alanyl-D-glutamate-2,6-diaminopimelate ligase [Parcubacteria group bacterium GW2011_GWA2_37_10]